MSKEIVHEHPGPWPKRTLRPMKGWPLGGGQGRAGECSALTSSGAAGASSAPLGLPAPAPGPCCLFTRPFPAGLIPRRWDPRRVLQIALAVLSLSSSTDWESVHRVPLKPRVGINWHQRLLGLDSSVNMRSIAVFQWTYLPTFKSFLILLKRLYHFLHQALWRLVRFIPTYLDPISNFWQMVIFKN